MKTALLVIDMQNDFILKGAPLRVRSISANLKKFGEFIDACRKSGMLIVYTRHIYGKINPMEQLLFRSIWNVALKPGQKGSEIVKELKPKKGDSIIKKTRYDAFMGTKLEHILRKNGIEQVIITGTMSNVCCDTTARTAMMKDFKVFFCSDLTFTNDSDVHRATLKTMAQNFAVVCTSGNIMKGIGLNK